MQQIFITIKLDEMNDQATQDLFEGMPIYYNRSGNLAQWDKVCFYELKVEEGLPEINPIPLHKMGYKFKRHVRSLVDFVNHITEEL